MMKDEDLDVMERQLGAFEISHAEHQRKLESIVSKYAALLEDYRTLKSDFEEERTNRERYKRMARGLDRNPFVLVLVDGNNYIFKDKFIKNRSEGGRLAAEVLEKSLRTAMPDIETECTIVVKVFVDLANISKTLGRLNLTGKESRSLSWFSSAFTRSRDHFEFIDTEDVEGTRLKIRENFRMFVDSMQCKKIIFAACHDVSHFQLLSPYRRRSEKIMLVRSAPWAPEFEKMELKIAEFGSVFRTTSLDNAVPMEETKAEPSNKPAELSQPDTNDRASRPTQVRVGLNGASMHAPVLSPSSPAISSPSKVERPPFPEGTHPVAPSGPSSSKFRSSSPSHSSRAPLDLASQLPAPDMAHLIPLNAESKRIDTYLEKPTRWAWESFNLRVKRQKVCNEHHLGGMNGGCPKGSSCAFDHSPLSDEQYLTLRAVVREYPCPRKGACRSSSCYYGHICVKEGCHKPNGACKLKAAMHGLSPVVSQWVEPDPPQEHYGPASRKNNHESVIDMNWRERREADRASVSTETRGQGLHRKASSENSVNWPERRTHDDDATWSNGEGQEEDKYRFSDRSSSHIGDGENVNQRDHLRDEDAAVNATVTLRYDDEDEDETRRKAEEEILVGDEEAHGRSEDERSRIVEKDTVAKEVKEEEEEEGEGAAGRSKDEGLGEEESHQGHDKVENEDDFDTQSQHEMSINFNREDHMVEDTDWQATLASSIINSNNNNNKSSASGWGNRDDDNDDTEGNAWGQATSTTRRGDGAYGKEDYEWNLPVNTNTKKMAGAGSGSGWGDHADGTWDTQGWADEAPQSNYQQQQKQQKRQQPPVNFSDETPTWEGESPVYDGGYQHQQYQQPQHTSGPRSNSNRGGSRGGRGGYVPRGSRGGRGGYVPPHQRNRNSQY